MTNIKKTILGLGVVVALSACGANPANQIAPTNPSNPAANVLQFRVGTANLFGAATGVNVVETFRQPAGGYNPGDSAALVSTPQIYTANHLPPTGQGPVPYDPTSTIWTGPAPGESGHLITATAQNPGSTNQTTFGWSGGAFGIGIEPYNYYGPFNAPAPNLVNTPFQVAPYPVPLYNPVPAPTPTPIGTASPLPPTPAPPLIANAFEPWGGPPAFDLLGNGTSPVGAPNVPAGTAGIGMGLDVFNMAPATGTYRLSVLEATNVGNVTQTRTAALNAGVVMKAVPAQKLGEGAATGGASGAVAAAGATEMYVQVTDYGPVGFTGCNGAHAGTPIYYTIVVHGAAGTATLPSSAGPGGSPSLCSSAANTASNSSLPSKPTVGGDVYTVQIIAFDYPMYEASYPSSLHNPAPSLGAHQTDLSISPAACSVYSQAVACPAPPFPGQPLLRRGANVFHVGHIHGKFYK